ncbi:Oryzin [Orbilia brochopaga]|nr:Oryzin [Drechslerella brochopaga]
MPPKKYSFKWLQSEDLGKVIFTVQLAWDLDASTLYGRIREALPNGHYVDGCFLETAKAYSHYPAPDDYNKSVEELAKRPDPETQEVSTSEKRQWGRRHMTDSNPTSNSTSVKFTRSHILNDRLERDISRGNGPAKRWEGNADNEMVQVTRNAYKGLPVLSAPRDLALAQIPPISTSYYHDKTPGKGVVVYVIDTGLDLDHPEFEHANIQDWINTGHLPGDYGEYIAAKDVQHGTAITGKIAGKKTGIAQDAEIVVVPHLQGDGVRNWWTVFEALLKTRDHIRAHNAHRACIINMAVIISAYGGPYAENSLFYKLAIEALASISELGNTVQVYSAGNRKGETITSRDLPSFAATFQRRARRPVKNTVIAGGLNPRGYNMYQQPGPDIIDDIQCFVYAPTYQIAVAIPRVPELKAPRDYYTVLGEAGTSIGQ